MKNVAKSVVITAVMVQAGYLLLMIPMPWDAMAVKGKLLTAGVELPLLVGSLRGIYVGYWRGFWGWGRWGICFGDWEMGEE